MTYEDALAISAGDELVSNGLHAAYIDAANAKEVF